LIVAVAIIRVPITVIATAILSSPVARDKVRVRGTLGAAAAKTEADCVKAGGTWDAATNTCAEKKP
jgi:hypothetical protein